MKIFNHIINCSSTGKRPTFHNLSEEIREFVKNTGTENGQCLVYSRHTTCAILIDEESFDKSYSGLTFLQQDLVDVFEKTIPTCRKEGQYMHPGPELTIFAAEHGEDKEGTLNTDAHLRSSIVGRSEVIPIIDGKLILGDFGNVYFIDFDQTRARDREVIVQVISFE
ncbi:MAG TPA: YjbQ family protein [Clostridiaceae bacterium]|nr:YjbQ family protein [Clostridiaceae bacterium]